MSSQQHFPSRHRPRETKRVSLPLDEYAQDGLFSGYASLFGKVDMGKDKVEQGAFARSLKLRKKTGIRMLFQHDPSEPIGVWEEIREDERGLFVKGRIVRDSAKGAEVLSLLRAGAVDGLSIGFRTEKSRTNRTSGIRSILEADLMEISIVTFPMLPQARVSQVKNQGEIRSTPLPTVREFERWLTQDARLTRSEARTIIGKGFAYLSGKQDAAGDHQPVLMRQLRRATRLVETTTHAKLDQQRV